MSLAKATSSLDAVSLDLVVERLAADAEAFGGFEFVAVGFLEHLDDGVAFHAFEQGEARVVFLARNALDVGVMDRSDDVHFIAFAQQHGALDFVLQLAHVARPVEAGEPFDGLRRETA